VSTPPLAGGEDDRSVRWRLTLAYDGTGFHGFAAQEGQRTVAGELCGALTRITRTPVSLICAGRTDAGVHALGQVVHFDLPAGASDRLDGDSLVKSCNSQLGPAIVVREATIAPEGFDARHSATARRYRYLVVNAPVPDPLLARLAWQVADPLELRSMQAASDTLLGQHDFRAFCRRVPGTTADDPITRRVDQVRWSRWGGPPGWKGVERQVPGTEFPALVPAAGSLLAFEIEAGAFCHQMVRSLVGTLVDVGRGRKRPSDMLWILRSGDRQQASQPAPPQGLTLMAVRYDR
jgi:tRNA pseudouridine38-40 synthase